MMQSPQVDDHNLVLALVHEYFAGLLRLILFQSGDSNFADQVAKNTIWTAVHDRHRYWGDLPLKVWIYSLAQKNIKQLGKDDRPKNVSSIFDQKKSLPAHDAKPSPGEEPFVDVLKHLPDRQKLILFLRCADSFSSSDISHILGISQNSAQHQLQRLRETLIETLYPEEKPVYYHKLFTRLIQSTLDSSLEQNEREELKLHLSECKDCQLYTSHLDQLQKKLSRLVPQIWPPLPPIEGEAQVVSAIETSVQEKSRSRILSASLKETAFIGLIVFVVLVIGILAKVTAPATPSPTPQDLNLGGATQSLGSAEAGSLPVSTPQPGVGAFPSTGGSGPSREYRGRILPGHYDLVKFDNLLRSPESHLMISGDNQSGSASLTMALRYWDWTGNAIRDLQPKSTDPNILPAEILNYVESKTNLKAIQRTAGDINTIKRLVYAGIPVIVETGLQVSSDQPWSSQYELITGFDDDWESVSILASYDIPGVYAEIGYIDFSQDWQAYNNLFIVIFPPSLQDRVDRILGAGTSFTPNDQYSSQTGAVQENVGNILYQFYDLYYQGTIEMQLNDYQLASSIYDQAFNILNHLTYDGRPWQFLASKSFPYQAYFYTKQYLRIIDLATQILRNNQNQEESYYWRSLAENALGDRNSAIIDMSRAVRIDPNFKLGVAWLARYRDGG